MDDPDEGGRGCGIPNSGVFGYVEVETQFFTMRSHFFSSLRVALVGSASEVEAFAIWCDGGGGDPKADDLVVEAGTALALDEGHSFFCTQYAQVMISSAASLGWVDRALALRRHQGVNQKGGSTEHTTTEIWSNQFRKWIMLDPTSNMYFEKDGIPLNAWEIRQEWFYNEGKDLVIVVGKDRKRYRKGDLPVHLATFQGFGDLTIEPDEIDKYGFIGYIPNTDIMDSGYDYGKMFIVHDKVCEGTKWHTRDLPANPASDPYFPIGQSTLSLTNEGGKLIVSSKTMTPNFKRFESRSDGGDWKPTGDRFEWKLKDGENHLEVRTVNAFGVIGPVSSVDIQFNK